MNKEILKKTQLIMLEELIELDRICKKYEIKYWIDSGTFLGAIRHKGFIPWDDDIDVCMLREDYKKFLLIAKEELVKKYFLQTEETDINYHNYKKIIKYYPNLITKIRDRNSIFIEKEHEKYYDKIKFHQGVYLDIFLMDRFDFKFNLGKIYKFLMKIANLRYPNIEEKYKIIKKIIVSLRINYFLNRILNSIININEKGNIIRYDYLENKLYKYTDIFPLSEIEFEGHKFPCPNDADAYLKELYGDTYMELPPEKDRVWHAKEIRLNEKCFFEKELERTGRKLYEDE